MLRVNLLHLVLVSGPQADLTAVLRKHRAIAVPQLPATNTATLPESGMYEHLFSIGLKLLFGTKLIFISF